MVNRRVLRLILWFLSVAIRVQFLVSGKSKLNILIFHRVLELKDPLRPWEPDAQEFDKKLELLSKYFSVYTVEDGLEKLKDNKLCGGALSISFDDGYRDNLTVALPLLKKWDLPATVYVSTGFSEGEVMWNDILIDSIAYFTESQLDLTGLGLGLGCYVTACDQDKYKLVGQLLATLKYLSVHERLSACNKIAKLCGFTPKPLMMNCEQIAYMASQGIEIGAHTVTHPILKVLGKEDQMRELTDSKRILERVLKRGVSGFAYPNGAKGLDYDDDSVECARRAGFSYAVTTNPGVCYHSSNIFELNRYSPWDANAERFCLRLMLNMLLARP